MKKITSLLALLLLCSCFETPERECKDFKTGKFRFDYEVDGIKKTTTFIRTENQEIDFYEGKSDTSSIKWINDCEYVIQKINPKNMQEKKAIAMKILSTSKNSYTFEFGMVGSSEKQTGTVVKIE
ncbi:hypothetical protein [Flavobacterium soli]|uniref:hypothetical protein n=1 Tax=Flavobacterium soli TaxID=344881 RepID=UPI0004261E90|nr:hypothetical protein [Flavobacterium soli]